jgi:hypothetical protein
MIESGLAQGRGRISGPNGQRRGLDSTLNSRIEKLKIRKSRFKLG